MAVAYGVIALVSLVLLKMQHKLNSKSNKWLFLITMSIFVCNFGYFAMSISKSVEMALMFNRVSYLGSVFLPMFMLMLILEFCNIKTCKKSVTFLVVLGIVVLLIASSGGYSTIYYKSVDITFVGGATKLIKEYGPLHILYGVYLFLYFISMLVVILYSNHKKTIISNKVLFFLLASVLGNMVIWLLEQLIHSDFEFLSVFYIITEMMLMLLYEIIKEYNSKHVNDNVNITFFDESSNKIQGVLLTENEIDSFLLSIKEYDLSKRESEVLRFVLKNKTRKEIASELYISESTVKKHIASIYRKLGTYDRTDLYKLVVNNKSNKESTL